MMQREEERLIEKALTIITLELHLRNIYDLKKVNSDYFGNVAR